MGRSNVLSDRFAITEGMRDKRVWDEAEELDKHLEAFTSEDDEGDPCEDRCDRCGQSTLLCGELVPTRDIDEGMHGPVYHVCQKCYAKQQAALQAEFEETCHRMGLTPAQAMGE